MSRNARAVPWPLTEKEAQRFWSGVDKRGPDECWPWRRTTDGKGYGTFWLRKGQHRAHRVAWAIANQGASAAGLMGCHACDNTLCCNPAHIWMGTNKENQTDAFRKGRQVPPPLRPGYSPWNKGRSHCKRGHEFTPENTVIRKSKGVTMRKCGACMALRGEGPKRKWPAALAQEPAKVEGPSPESARAFAARLGFEPAKAAPKCGVTFRGRNHCQMERGHGGAHGAPEVTWFPGANGSSDERPGPWPDAPAKPVGAEETHPEDRCLRCRIHRWAHTGLDHRFETPRPTPPRGEAKDE